MKIRNPKVRGGKIYRIVKMPVSLHEKIKELAGKNSKKISQSYEEIINDFLTRIGEKDQPVNYLFHQGIIKDITFGLSVETADAIRTLSIAQSVPETRIMFTAIVQFAEKNGWRTG